MENFFERYPNFINSVLLIIGFLLTIIGIYISNQSKIISTIIIALSVNLIVMAVTGFLYTRYTAPQSQREMQKMISNSIGSPVTLFNERATLTKSYKNHIEKATQIDLAGLSLKGFFINITKDFIIECLKKGKRFTP